MVKKVEEEKQEVWNALIRFMRGAVASGLVALGGFLIANSFDFANWKQYSYAALIALGTGIISGASKYVRETYGVDLKII